MIRQISQQKASVVNSKVSSKEISELSGANRDLETNQPLLASDFTG